MFVVVRMWKNVEGCGLSGGAMAHMHDVRRVLGMLVVVVEVVRRL